MSDRKKDILKKLDGALGEGLVDTYIIPILDVINSIDSAVTTSSCSGRIQLIQAPSLGDKKGSVILGKWHDEVSPEEVIQCLPEWNRSRTLLLLAQPLLVHARCRDLCTAYHLRNTAHQAGLKFSTIRSIRLDDNGDLKEWGAVVEMLGTERMEVPLHTIDADLFESIIPPLIEHGNHLLRRTRSRISVLMVALSDQFGNDPPVLDSTEYK